MKILIVDDEPLVRRSLERAFLKNGDRVLTAEDGKTGLELWRQSNPDLVLLDVLMPVMSGPQVLEEFRGAWTCKVILMSAFTGEETQDFKDRYKVDLFLAKPFEDIFKVVEAAHTLLDQ